MASPKVQPCRVCKDVGILAFGRDVQYCLCPIGREKKQFWLALPACLRDPEELISRTLPDAKELRGVA